MFSPQCLWSFNSCLGLNGGGVHAWNKLFRVLFTEKNQQISIHPHQWMYNPCNPLAPNSLKNMPVTSGIKSSIKTCWRIKWWYEPAIYQRVNVFFISYRPAVADDRVSILTSNCHNRTRPSNSFWVARGLCEKLWCPSTRAAFPHHSSPPGCYGIHQRHLRKSLPERIHES